MVALVENCLWGDCKGGTRNQNYNSVFVSVRPETRFIIRCLLGWDQKHSLATVFVRVRPETFTSKSVCKGTTNGTRAPVTTKRQRGTSDDKTAERHQWRQNCRGAPVATKRQRGTSDDKTAEGHQRRHCFLFFCVWLLSFSFFYLQYIWINTSGSVHLNWYM